MALKMLLENLREEVSCSVCMNSFTDPKQLPCLHSFCLSCLNGILSTSSRKNAITCPLCQKVCGVPESGNLDDLPTSFYLNSMLDALAIKECNKSQVKCGNCDTKSSQTFYCFQCFEFWCADCINAHNAIRTNRHHRVLALKDFQDEDLKDVLKRPTFCRKQRHENEELKFFCKNCEVAVCNTCVVTLHPGHVVILLDEAANERKLQVNSLIETKRLKEQTKINRVNQLEEECSKIQEHVANVKRDVQSFVENMLAVIEAKKQQVFTVVEDRAKESIERLRARKNEVENQLKMIERTKTLLKRGTGPEIVELKKSLDSMLKQMERDEKQDREIADLPSFTFIHNKKMFDLLNSVDGIGSLQFMMTETQARESTAEGKGLDETFVGLEAQFVLTTRNTAGRRCFSPFDRVAVTVKNENGKDCASKVAIKGNKHGVYRICYFAKEVGICKVTVKVNGEHVRGSPYTVPAMSRVFKSVQCFGLRGSSVGMLDKPWGLAVSEHNEIAVCDSCNFRVQLFVNDGHYSRTIGRKGNGEGQFIQPNGIAFANDGNILVADSSANQIQMFSTEGKYLGRIGGKDTRGRQPFGPCGLSVDSDGNIIAADPANKAIKIFSSNGEFVQAINSKGCLVFPIHCVQYGTHFIVSDRDDHSINVFDREGHFLYKFGKKGMANGEFNTPGCLSVTKSGHLLVCDTYNHRIQVFEPSGEFVTKFGTQGNRKGEFNFPLAIATLSDGRVVVSEYGNHRIQVFE